MKKCEQAGKTALRPSDHKGLFLIIPNYLVFDPGSEGLSSKTQSSSSHMQPTAISIGNWRKAVFSRIRVRYFLFAWGWVEDIERSKWLATTSISGSPRTLVLRLSKSLVEKTKVRLASLFWTRQGASKSSKWTLTCALSLILHCCKATLSLQRVAQLRLCWF